jgi:LytS/YehU family sensor histidine kinase
LKLATEAQLASLESKLHPHFLFNTLNSISALIADDPVLADKVVLRLSRLLRSSLDVVDQSSVPLDEEIKLTVDYLEIEKARFGERLRYSVDVPRELLTMRVAPLILQPIVENSVKFAIFPRPGGGSIAISAQQESDKLTIAVRDDGPGFAATVIPAGHGLDTLRQRLNTLFQDRAILTIAAAEERTTVSISIPIST